MTRRELQTLLLQNDELRERFNDELAERKAIMEFEGNQTREQANKNAVNATVESWLERYKGEK